MKSRITKIVVAILLLMLLSGCSGIKPYFSSGNIPGFTKPFSTVYQIAGIHSGHFSYVPDSSALSSRDNIMMNCKKGSLKLSISFPPSARLDF
jgi:hypothetical protein